MLVSIVENEPVGRLRGDHHAELLDGPLGGGMLGDIPVDDPTRANLEDDEDVENLESDRDCREEVTRYDRVGMNSTQRSPTAGTVAGRPPGAPAAGGTVRRCAVTP
jgi:hypothetical protein